MRCDLVIRDPDCDAAIVGSGPNGLAAAIVLARNGLRVIVLEAKDRIGGGVRTGELTLPGFLHDEGAAVLPMAAASPFFKSLPLADFGLTYVYPPAALAHPFDDGTAARLTASVAETADTLGQDASSYSKLLQPLVNNWDRLLPDVLGTMRSISHPLAGAQLALRASGSAAMLLKRAFTGSRARGFFAGLAAHSVLPLDRVPSAAYGLIMCITGHTAGWPMPAGGAGKLSSALHKYLESLGGTLVMGQRIRTGNDLPRAGSVFFDTSPRQMMEICGDRLPAGYRKSLGSYRYGPGVFKMDWALSAPIPWKAGECRRAGTVHLGGTYEEIAAAELAPWQGKVADKPFVMLVQPSLFDSTRCPPGKHTAWAYCHVPNGCNLDLAQQVESQVERFAPGFKDIIIARRTWTPAMLEESNANLVGGDIVGGAQTLRQLFCRPSCRAAAYSTPLKGVYLCSASTPPGAGVHGMCGYHAARAYLKSERHVDLE